MVKKQVVKLKSLSININWRTAKTGESEAYQLTAEVGRQLSRLYEYYGYYLKVQFKKKKKIKLNMEQQTFQEVILRDSKIIPIILER